MSKTPDLDRQASGREWKYRDSGSSIVCGDVSKKGGLRHWVVSGHGYSEDFKSAHSTWIRVGELLKEGYRTIRIERQGFPSEE